MDSFFIAEMIFNCDVYEPCEIASQIRKDFGVKVTGADVASMERRILSKYYDSDADMFSTIEEETYKYLVSIGAPVIRRR